MFTDKDICQLIDVNSYGKHKVKNEYLINQLMYLALSLTEHNLLKVHDLINEKGEVYRKFAIPKEYTKHLEERVIELPEKFILSVEKYLEWYVKQDIPSEYRHNLHTYRGLSEDAPMLLNDEFKEYKLTKNKSPNGARLQPNNLRNKVKSLLSKAGLEWATFSTFSDSLIIYLHKNNAPVQDIIKAFAFRGRETVLNRINGNVVTLGEAINKVYERVPVTGYKK
ncbi:hypothetical protein GCM10025767_27990 [Thalassotalea piscium]